MIIEAFAKYLQAADPSVPASSVLARWLWERLSLPAEDQVDRVLRCEIDVDLQRKARRSDPGSMLPKYHFSATTKSGKQLLRSLYEYALSYEQQKWSRWVHCVKASDFNQLYNSEQ